MSKRPHTPSYPVELRERGVRLFREHRGEYASDNAAIGRLRQSWAALRTVCACGASARNETQASVLV